jgi:hypothetical protein
MLGQAASARRMRSRNSRIHEKSVCSHTVADPGCSGGEFLLRMRRADAAWPSMLYK